MQSLLIGYPFLNFLLGVFVLLIELEATSFGQGLILTNPNVVWSTRSGCVSQGSREVGALSTWRNSIVLCWVNCGGSYARMFHDVVTYRSNFTTFTTHLIGAFIPGNIGEALSFGKAFSHPSSFPLLFKIEYCGWSLHLVLVR